MLKRFFSANFILVAIILIASFLRLYKLSVSPPALFGDELDLGYQAYSILKTGRDYQGNFMPIHFHSLAEWRTPLYLYFAVPTVDVFGISPLGVRLPAAIFGILSVFALYLLVKELKIRNSIKIAEIAAFLLAISPWSLQYSRAGFEVTFLLLLLLFGLYFFVKSLSDSKWLWLSILCLVLTPWVYATAKLFTPLLLILLFLVYKYEILVFKRSNILKAIIIGLFAGTPILLSTLFGGGTQRISDISIFTDPQMEQAVGYGRDLDSLVGISPTLSKVVNNKYVYFGNIFVTNYLKSFSTDFLFLNGDTNLRQSTGVGMLYIIEVVPLLFGLGYFFFDTKINGKLKKLIGTWLVLAPIPGALTLNGGSHATRLILVLPLLIFFVANGWVWIHTSIPSCFKKIFAICVFGLYIISFSFYWHRYYSVYPIESEKWWHYGWTESITEIKKIDKDYDRVIISMAGEPAWIFFAANYEYSPSLWQTEYPIGRDVELKGFGKVSHTGKFYFGSPNQETQIYGLGRVIDSKTLYLANASEDGDNLLINPEKIPSGLKLLKTVKFLTGQPAFYLFSGVE